MSVDQAVVIANAIGFIGFVSLLALAVVRMAIRLIFYTVTGREASIILRRDFTLLGSLVMIFGFSAIARYAGWYDYLSSGWPKLIYIIVSDVIGISSLGYWVWAEYFVIGRPGKEED